MYIRKSSKCSTVGKTRLFRSYCSYCICIHSASEMTYIVSGGALNSTHSRICIHDAGLWSRYRPTKGCLQKLYICYYWCIKMFFGYSKMNRETAILFDLGPPSFNW